MLTRLRSHFLSPFVLLAALALFGACGDDGGGGGADDDSDENPVGEDDDGDDDDNDADDDGDDDDESPLDGGSGDASTPRIDGGRDSGNVDASSRDATASDGASDPSDGAAGDASRSDASVVDASGLDASAPDGGSDAAVSISYDQPGPYTVVQENNVGRNFANNVSDDSALCELFLPALGEGATPEELEAFANPPNWDRSYYTVFRPDPLESGKKYPVVTWGNGTCAAPVGYDDLLKHIASHGYIVVAANSRQVGNGQVMRRALDFLAAENQRSGSVYFEKVDLTKVGASGHSQGGGAAITATVADARITAAVLVEPGGGSGTLNKPAFFIAGENDTVVSPSIVRSAYNAARGPSLYGLSEGSNHSLPIRTPARMWGPTVAWFKAHLEREPAARALFYGQCSLCSDPAWSGVQRKNLN